MAQEKITRAHEFAPEYKFSIVIDGFLSINKPLIVNAVLEDGEIDSPSLIIIGESNVRSPW